MQYRTGHIENTEGFKTALQIWFLYLNSIFTGKKTTDIGMSCPVCRNVHKTNYMVWICTPGCTLYIEQIYLIKNNQKILLKCI